MVPLISALLSLWKIEKMRLEDREHRCSCGYVCDRDLNAAKIEKDAEILRLRELLAKAQAV